MHLKLTLLPPAEAVEYLRSKGYDISFDWEDVYAEEHARAFTVAKMTSIDLLQTVHDHVTRAVEEGRSLRDFTRDLRPILEAAGWWGRRDMTDPQTGEIREVQLGSPRRLAVIYDTNLRTSYSAGRWQRAQRASTRLPYLLYRTMRDARVRPLHRIWDGTALPQSDPWWETHYPPNGWRCRCIAYPISERDLNRLETAFQQSEGRRGVEVKRRQPALQTRTWTNPRTGEIREIPLGIDPGFDYNPGKSAQAHLDRLLAERQAAFRRTTGEPE